MIEWSLAKVLVLCLLGLAVISLVGGLRHLTRGDRQPGDEHKLFRSLMLRVCFSGIAVAIILIAGFSGKL